MVGVCYVRERDLELFVQSIYQKLGVGMKWGCN